MEVIFKCAVDFFFDGSVISSAKMEFWNTVNNDIQPPKRIGTKAASNNVKNILGLLRKCDNDDLDIPCYIIRVPTEVPLYTSGSIF
ncbi:hypothetical protein QYM36_012467 [Artemia franciscana]|uniref:Uncharacterized protein n=1 Tax=Artemia franciscana TaxID=6661 RepID=A0AA88HP74_ARTSF|nr:hypothetical protein QYM36_012467 [Artemia franciscana]